MQDGFQVILLAPALADGWKKGSATGLRTRGGLKVDLSWQNGRVQATATATRPGNPVHASRQEKDLSMNKGETARLDFPPLSH
ncbi:MAG: glycoside hydrolase family 95-like protein [Akkermansia sp.]